MATPILSASDAPASYKPFKCVACGLEGMAAPSNRVRVYCNAACGNRLASEKGRAETVIRKHAKRQARNALKAVTPPPHSKTCTKCGETRAASEFSKAAKKRDGLKAACKQCCNAERVAYDALNKEAKAANWLKRKADPESHGRKLAHGKAARDAARASVLGWDKWVPLHDGHVRAKEAHFATCYSAHVAAWHGTLAVPVVLHDAQVKTFKKAKAEYRTWRWMNDPTHSLYSRLQGGIKAHVQYKSPARVWRRRLGYTMDELRVHIERQFTKGMTWENKDKWHLDHIVAASTFEIESVYSPEFRACFGLHNLRPLWADENIKKGAKREFLL